MKCQYLILLIGITFPLSTAGLEIEKRLEIPWTITESMAFIHSMKLSKGIASGINSEAVDDASIECPDDNHPSFSVDTISIHQYWLADAQSSSNKRYSGTVNYTLKCSHDRSSGGDR